MDYWVGEGYCPCRPPLDPPVAKSYSTLKMKERSFITTVQSRHRPTIIILIVFWRAPFMYRWLNANIALTETAHVNASVMLMLMPTLTLQHVSVEPKARRLSDLYSCQWFNSFIPWRNLLSFAKEMNESNAQSSTPFRPTRGIITDCQTPPRV